MSALILPVVILATLTIAAMPTNADGWVQPRTRAHMSDNDEYCLVVVPGRERLNRYCLPEELKFAYTVDLPPHGTAMGTLYRKDRNSVYQPVWTAPLADSYEPVNVLVHDGGKWVVTIDSWGGMGYGDHVVVIHNRHGDIVRKFALADMLPPEKIAGFRRSTSSIWWFYDAWFLDETDQLEIRIVSNGETARWSRTEICEDYLRIDLAAGEVVSFVSKFDEALATYPDSCFDDYNCPSVRYIYYRMNNPDSSVFARFDSLELSGNQIDSLRRVYEYFSRDYLWNLGAALQYMGRKVVVVVEGIIRHDFALLVEAPCEMLEGELRDSFPVIVQLSESSLAFPLSVHDSAFSEAVLRGGEKMFSVLYSMDPCRSDSSEFEWRPWGLLSEICTPDSALRVPTNVSLERVTYGTRIFIDLTKRLVREKTP